MTFSALHIQCFFVVFLMVNVDIWNVQKKNNGGIKNHTKLKNNMYCKVHEI